MRSALSFLLISFCLTVRAQSPEQTLVASLDSFASANPQEKVFLHADKNDYTAGETIWFKTYITLEARPSYLSRKVYVELINEKGQLVEKRMLKADQGRAAGDISLKEDIPSGNYRLQAYTLWMLNYPEFIFRKNIFIYNTDFKKATSASAPAGTAMQFFAEGGELIEGLPARIGFKAITATGLPDSISGEVLDSKNKVVATFATAHDGMGLFELTPVAGESYAAYITADGKKSKFAVPAARSEGVTMTVSNENPNKLFVLLNRSEKNKALYNNIVLVAQMEHQVVFTGKVNFDEGQAAAAIDKKKLPPGIVQLTVFTHDGKPLAERLAFIANHALPSALTIDTVQIAARKKNVFSLDFSGYNGITASVSVINAAADNSLHKGDNIVSGLLLSSDLKGYIHHPAFYFKDKEASTLQKLDLLMMTHGWRRFNWNNVVAGTLPALRYPVESGIVISGRLTGAGGKTGLQAGKLDLITKAEDSTTILSTATINGNNEFLVPDLDFKKTATVYYQGTNLNKQKSLVSVQFNPSYFDTLSKGVVSDYRARLWPGSLAAYTQQVLAAKARADEAKGKLLSEVIVTGRRRSPVDSLNRLYATDLFFNSDQTLIVDPTSTYLDIWQFLQRSVPGISILNSDTGKRVFFDLYAGIDVFSESGASSVQFFLNEVPVSVDIIDFLNPADIGMVKVYKGATGITLGAIRGAIAVYTSKGKAARDWRQKGFEAFSVQGYSVSREFYHLDYSMIDPKSAFSDRRETLYWNPEIRPDANGKTFIRFYNDDFARGFKVVVEGMDKEGKLLHVEQIVQ